MLTDSTIWKDFRDGKDYALSYIYYCQVEPLFQYGRKFTKDEALIKDTIQEVFYHLIRSRSALGDANNIRFYLMSAFKHRILRSMQAEKHLEGTNSENFSYELSISYSHEDEIIDKENEQKRVQVIRKILRTITPKQREILYYRYTCDYSYEEICQLMSIKYDSARKMVFRALQSLREHLDHSDLVLFYLFRKKL